MPPPDDPRATWLRRVQALLAQAESTPYPHEAETFLAKAQELMTRHAIDESMLRTTSLATSEVVSERVTVEPPYASARAALLGQVARANGCRLVICSTGRGAQHCVLVGHRSDVASTQMLFAALSLHATRTMLAAPVPAGDTFRRFRHAFLLAFAHRIGQRLQAATHSVQHEAETSGGAAVALALRDRNDAVEDALRAQFPRLGTRLSSASSQAGAHHGRTAADRAQLTEPILPTGRRGLPGA